MKNLLVVGAIPDHKHKLRYGGATVLMYNFLLFLESEKINYRFAQTNKFSNLKTGEKRNTLNKIYFLLRFLILLPWCDTVMFNFSDNGVCSVFPFLASMAKFFKKKIVLRKFGGSFEIYYSKLPQSTQNKVLKSIKKCDLVLFETKAGIEHLKKLTDNQVQIEWFSNVRDKSNFHKNPKQIEKRLGFISEISDEKGIADLLQMAKFLAPEYRIDIYGHIKDEKYIDFDWSAHNVTYHGAIQSEKVPEVLQNLLLLLLPSYREGYPGIIIEAMSVGVPVLSTTVGGIPEMITDGIEGFIVSPGDVNSAVRKIRSLDPQIYERMYQNALDTFNKKFESRSTNTRILNLLKELK